MPAMRFGGRETYFFQRLQPEGRWMVQHRLLPKNRSAQTKRLCWWRLLCRLTHSRPLNALLSKTPIKTPFLSCNLVTDQARAFVRKQNRPLFGGPAIPCTGPVALRHQVALILPFRRGYAPHVYTLKNHPVNTKFFSLHMHKSLYLQ